LDTVIELETVVLSLAFDPNEAILALGCVDHSIHLWHLPSARELTRLHGHSGTVEAIAFSPDGQLLASCSVDETIHLWNMSDGSSLQTLHTPGLYAGMMIAGVTGMSEAQKIALKMLGAIDDPV
jgi:WD40 repeat protein